MNTADTYETYAALKAHFKTGGKYDYFKYRGKLGNFNINNVKNARHFHTLSNRYPIKQDMEDYCVGNCIYGSSGFILDYNEDAMHEYQKNKGAMLYNLEADMVWIIEALKRSGMRWENLYTFDNQFNIPPLYRMWRQKFIKLETLVILDYLAPFLDEWNKDPMMTHRLEWPEIYHKAKQYKAFLNIKRDAVRTVVGTKLKEW